MTISLKQASIEFLENLKEEGKAERSLYTYGMDLEQIRAYFGNEKIISKILIPHVAGFMKSDGLLKKNSKEGLILRAKPTIDKTIRIFRMLMIWAKDKGYVERLPFTKEFQTSLCQK
jgi:site-specific recombinase XerD